MSVHNADSSHYMSGPIQAQVPMHNAGATGTCPCDTLAALGDLVSQSDTRLECITECSLSLWLSGLIRFPSHSTCWAYLAGDLQGHGIKSVSRHELSVGWTNGRYAMRLISRTGTEGTPVSSLNCDRCRL